MKIVQSSCRDRSGNWDEFYNKRQPPKGFKYPEIGVELRALVNYKVIPETVIPADAVGTVTGIRKPESFKQNQGYIGLIVFFKEIEDKCLNGRVVIPWDMMEYFEFI